tara:strand:+ start:2701 stop:2955 length:255 start_codon:yes stop_codon:yes gene_type:complete
MKIDIKETQEWYAKERSIKVEEFDDYDAHVCRVANAYGNIVKKLTTPVVIEPFVCVCPDENWVYDESGVDMYCKKCSGEEASNQ